jgi:hypothetical protein
MSDQTLVLTPRRYDRFSIAQGLAIIATSIAIVSAGLMLLPPA